MELGKLGHEVHKYRGQVVYSVRRLDSSARRLASKPATANFACRRSALHVSQSRCTSHSGSAPLHHNRHQDLIWLSAPARASPSVSDSHQLELIHYHTRPNLGTSSEVKRVQTKWHNAVIDKKSHQVLTFGSVSVGLLGPQWTCLFSRQHCAHLLGSGCLPYQQHGCETREDPKDVWSILECDAKTGEASTLFSGHNPALEPRVPWSPRGCFPSQEVAAWTRRLESRSFSKIGNKWSAVMPDGPAVAPSGFSETINNIFFFCTPEIH